MLLNYAEELSERTTKYGFRFCIFKNYRHKDFFIIFFLSTLRELGLLVEERENEEQTEEDDGDERSEVWFAQYYLFFVCSWCCQKREKKGMRGQWMSMLDSIYEIFTVRTAVVFFPR